MDSSGFDWSTLAEGRVRVHCRPGSFTERHRIALLRSGKAAIERVLDYLGEEVYERSLDIVYVDSRDEMQTLIGHTYAGFSAWGASGVFLVCSADWRSFDTHEIAHVISINLWGQPSPSSRWMLEGLAVAVDGFCSVHPVDEIAARLLAAGELPPLAALIRDPEAFGEIRAGIGAASFIDFVRSRRGPPVLRELWHGDRRAQAELLGEGLARLEASWHDHLRKKHGSGEAVDLEQIDAQGCG